MVIFLSCSIAAAIRPSSKKVQNGVLPIFGVKKPIRDAKQRFAQKKVGKRVPARRLSKPIQSNTNVYMTMPNMAKGTPPSLKNGSRNVPTFVGYGTYRKSFTWLGGAAVTPNSLRPLKNG